VKRLQVRSLFKKLYGSFIIVILVTVLTLGVFLPTQLANYLSQAAKVNLEEEARLIIPSIGIYFEGQTSYDVMQQILTTIEYFSDARVFLVDRSGQVLVTSAGYNANFRGELLPEDEIQALMQNQKISHQGYNARLNQYALTLAFPIVQNNNGIFSTIGALYMETPLAVFGTFSSLVQKQALIMVGFSAVTALILAFFFTQSITKPLNSLNIAAQAMARGNYAVSIPYQEEDEIGELILSFNNLSRSLQKSVDSLLTEKGRMENLLRSLTEGVIATQTDGSIVLFNPAAQQLLQLPSDLHLLGRTLETLSLPKMLRELLINYEDDIVTKILNFTPDRYVAVTLSPVLDRSGRQTGTMMVLKDITESHTLELQRKAFVANVSHELRTPLTSIRGFVEGILDETIPLEASARYLSIIQRETVRLSQMIQELLDLSYIESGQMILHPTEINLMPLLQRMIERCKSASKKPLQEYIIRFNQENPCIQADPDRLEQIFTNLLSNASKFAPENGKIQIIGVRVDDKMEITIQDNGPGISEQDLPYIWDRFYKADQSRSREGTGLGLSIVRSLIDAHQETIAVNNDPLGGCCFTFTMPLCLVEQE
jgi:two-component system sensor histidine kinase ResE